jgi:hydroxymethylbilane synthase
MVLDDPAARIPATAERAFLAALGGGCAAPIAAFGESFEGDGRRRLRLQGLVASLDGRQVVRATVEGEWNSGAALALDLAARITTQGGRALLP